MTTPNVRCTCAGTCHPQVPMRHPQLVTLAYADHRRWAFYSIGAMMCAFDTGLVHGPAPLWRVGQPMPAIIAERRMEGQIAAEREWQRARILAATDHIGRGKRDA